jgi:hypothetical protein
VKHWELMPTGLDILSTHGPPLEVLDCAPGQNFHGGCPQLRDAVIKKHPRLHVFGRVRTDLMTQKVSGRKTYGEHVGRIVMTEVLRCDKVNKAWLRSVSA